MSRDDMERRIDMGEIPAGGVVPTEDQARMIDHLVETGVRSYAGATMAILGVMPHRVYDPPAPEETPVPQEPVYDHSVRVAELTHAFRLDMSLGPKIAQLTEQKGDESSKSQINIDRTKRHRDQHMENGCMSCPHQDNCDIREKGWEDGMREVHPHLKPSSFGIVYETEPLREMIKRIVADPEAHCDDKIEDRLETPEITPEAPVLVEGMYDDTGEEEKRIVANFDLRNIHLDKADKALSERNRINRHIKANRPANEGRLAEESNDHFEIFASELEQACALCSHKDNCALVSDPVAWDEAKHYARSPNQNWLGTMGQNGVEHEPREEWRKRRKQDPQAPCPPNISNRERPKPRPPLPNPHPELDQAA